MSAFAIVGNRTGIVSPSPLPPGIFPDPLPRLTSSPVPAVRRLSTAKIVLFAA